MLANPAGICIANSETGQLSILTDQLRHPRRFELTHLEQADGQPSQKDCPQRA
jgi:hypothetical protein